MCFFKKKILIHLYYTTPFLFCFVKYTNDKPGIMWPT